MRVSGSTVAVLLGVATVLTLLTPSSGDEKPVLTRVESLERAVASLDRRVSAIEALLLAKKKEKAVVEAPQKTPAVVESQIDGEFEGWDGDTIFKLTNGQIWQQDSYAYTYRYAYMPKVVIFKSKDGHFKMKVDGVERTIRVRRLK